MMLGGPQGIFIVALVLSRTFALPQPPALDNDAIDYDDDANIFLRQTRKHARPMFYINCGYRDLCYCYSKITRHHYCCSCEVGACFPADARVATSAHTYSTMDALRTGDEVLAVDDLGKVVSSSVLGFMDRRPNERALYLTIRTAIGRNLTLSPNHVLFKSAPNSSNPISAFGSDINIGDIIFAFNKTGIERTAVIAIEHSIRKGAYVPLTKEGTIIVDGSFASCYASYKHDLAHAFLAPARTFPALLWPRPGFLSNMALLLKSYLQQVFFDDEFVVCKEECAKDDGDNNSLDYQTPVDNYIPEHSSYKQCHTGQEMAHIEVEGEAYYITIVKYIGWLLFRDQKAFSPVFQVDPRPQEKGFTHFLDFTHSFTHFPSSLLDFMPRSW